MRQHNEASRDGVRQQAGKPNKTYSDSRASLILTALMQGTENITAPLFPRCELLVSDGEIEGF